MNYPHGGAAQIWRDNEGGAPNNPEKSQIRDWGQEVEGRVSAEGVVSLDWYGADPTGATASDVAATAALTALPSRGGGFGVGVGQYRLSAEFAVATENVRIAGQSQTSSEIEVAHNGTGLSFTGQVVNLPDAKFAMADLFFTKATGNALDANGFPQTGWSGTAVKLTNAFACDFQRLQTERFDVGLDLASVYQSTFNQYLARNCWMGLKCSPGGDGKTTGNTFIGGIFNNSAFDLTNGEKFQFLGTDFEASSTTCIVSDRNVFENCRFERMHISRTFFPWLQFDGDFNKVESSQYFWDASTFVDDAETDFYNVVNGDHNFIEVQKIFTHQNFVRINSGAKRNTVLFNAPFTDFANTGNNNAYRRSGRLFSDEGIGTHIVFDNEDGRVETVGADTMEASGKLSNFLRYDSLSNLTINASTLTIAQSDISGPCGIPVAHVDNKKFTIDSVAATIRATSPTLATADGTTVYAISCYVQIPFVASPPTRVRIGDGSGVFTDIYPSDGMNKWHRVVVFTQPASGDPVQLMIEAEGDVADFFYVALPSVGVGNIPAYVPVPRDKTSWTTETTAKKVTTQDVQTPFGTDVSGSSYTPVAAGFGGTVSSTYGRFTKQCDMVHFTVRVTGTGLNASSGAATVSLPYSGGDGHVVVSDTDSVANIGTGMVLNGTVYLPAISSSNSITISGFYRLENV